MNKFKGLSKIQKNIVLIVLGILILSGGTASAYVIKNQYTANEKKKIEEAAYDFGDTKPKVTSNVDLNDIDKLDKNSEVTITIPIPGDSKYDYYYDERKTDDGYPNYKKIGSEWRKTIKLLNLQDVDGFGYSNYSFNNFLLVKKGETVEYSNISNIAEISSIKLVKNDNEDNFEQSVYKLKADNNAEKYDLNQYLDKKLDEPLKVSGVVHFEEGSENTTYVRMRKMTSLNRNIMAPAMNLMRKNCLQKFIIKNFIW